MNFQEIKQIIINALGDQAITGEVTAGVQPQLIIPAKEIVEVCKELQQNENAYFDLLSCMTGIDNGEKMNTMEVIYNLYSITLEHHLVLKVILDRTRAEAPEAFPRVPSVSNVYKTALWHEREIFDFFGIVFDGHPDLRRIFLPVDWKGYPLRKDYQQEEYYRGIRIEY